MLRKLFQFVPHSVAVVLIFLGTLFCQPVQAADPPTWALAVDADVSGGLGDGSSWANAFDTLQEALTDAANDPDITEIWVANGTYYPTTGSSRTASFYLQTGLAIYGGFQGNSHPQGGEGQLSQRAPWTNITILSGDIGTANDPDDNSYHVVRANQVSGTALLDGFTIQHGNALVDPDSTPPPAADDVPAQVPPYSGGGMAIYTCDFVNPGPCPGPTCCVDPASTPTIVRCWFKENRAIRGGGVAIQGAGYNQPGDNPTFINCRFSDNVAEAAGGAVYVVGPDTPGMALLIEEMLVDAFPGPCAISANPIFRNCLIWNGNRTQQGLGGAIYAGGSNSVSLRNCTIVRNLSGIHAVGGNCSAASLYSCIVYYNGPDQPNPPQWFFLHQLSGAYCVNYSDVQLMTGSGDCSVTPVGNTTANPQFVDNLDDFHLECGSPCTDAGYTDADDLDNGVGQDVNDLDQDGNTTEPTPDLDRLDRTIGPITTSPADDAMDMGCYENQDACNFDVNGDGTVDVDDLLAVINAWGACPSPPTACPADIAPVSPCGGNGTVNVDDLLLVINNWGANCGGGAGAGSKPNSQADCEDICENEGGYTPGSGAFNDCVDRCMEGV